jgi:aryl-alcohol dehydrogenase-like predicted oxidoreductase
METRTLGKSDLKVSVVGLGCNNFGQRIDDDASRKVIHKALDAGITLFDTADIYGNYGGSETCLGKFLGPRRKDIVLATKFGMPMDKEDRLQGASRSYVLSALEASLKRLRTDWIDLYQLHRPDPKTPMEETLGVLNDIVRTGKVRYIGCSNLSAAQVNEALDISNRRGWPAFVTCQNEYSLLVRDSETDLVPLMQKQGMGFLPYFPLANGLLTGKYKRGQAKPEGARLSYMKNHSDRYLTEANWARVEKLQAFAASKGRSLIELAFCWLLAKPTMASVIAGATKPEQVEQNVRSAGWTLTPEEVQAVDAMSGGMTSR